MPISAGTRFGVYEITALIGAGGMGEVYRARDTRLNRDVAVKVLPPGVMPSADQLARFDREAQTLAALNHSNLAHVYGIEEYVAPSGDPARALVMELVEGEDLSQRLRSGPLPVEQALAVAVQIAGGLEAAHEQGIVHRDLKPANIKIRPDGTVKILDFGLAKALARGDQQAASPENSPTITSPAYVTAHGMVLGTAAYMSPEQARGRMVDKRADVWAFGAVLYEMLAGRRAFPGDTVSDTVAAVLKSEPDWALVPSATPHLARRVVMNCLRKDPRERLADIHDARIDLADALSRRDASGPAQPTPFAWQLLTLAGIAIVVIAAAIGVAWTSSSAPPMAGVIRSSLILTDQPAVNNFPVLAPDGKSMVYAAVQPAGLLLRRLDENTWRSLAGTEGASRPFWSPDSSQIAYFARGKIRSIHVASGVVKDIASVPSFFGGAWGTGESIVFGLQGDGVGLQRVEIGKGVATPLTSVDSSEIAHRWPFFFPDGRHFGYLSHRANGYQLMVGSLNGDAPRAITSTESSVAFAPPDIVLIVRDGNLFAHRVDLSNRALSEAGVKIAEQVGVGPTREMWLSTSATDALTYLPPRVPPRGRLAWVDRAGRVEYLPLAEGPYGEPALSPDGSRVALSVREESGAELWLYDIDRNTFGRRTFTRAGTFAVWSPDSRHLSFSHRVAQSGPLMKLAADGSGDPETLVSSVDHPGNKIVTSWAADGSIIFRLGGDLMIRRPDASIRPLLATAASEGEGRLSPDNQWLAYISDETGSNNVFVQSYPPGRGKWQISASGGAQPMWAPDGRELYFINADRMMAVAFELSPTFKPGVPRVLFEIPLPARDPGDPSRYGVSPDGKRFLVLTTDRPTTPQSVPIHLVSNWRSLLEQRRQ